jgi:hypothetical protein
LRIEEEEEEEEGSEGSRRLSRAMEEIEIERQRVRDRE